MTTSEMHEILHTVGLCPDALTHFDLLDLVVADPQFFTYLSFQTNQHVTKCKSAVTACIHNISLSVRGTYKR